MPMTKQEAAEFLGVTIRSIEAYATKGDLTPGKAKGKRGDITVYDEAELEKLKKKRGEITYIARPEAKQPEQPTSENLAPSTPSPQEALQIVLPASDMAVLGELLKRTLERLRSPATTKPPVRLLTLAEAAERSKLSVDHLRRAIKAGDLDGRRIGRGYKVTETDLDGYVEQVWNAATRKRGSSAAGSTPIATPSGDQPPT